MLRLDPETWEALQRIAAAEFRSVNGQIEFVLNDWLRKNYGKGAGEMPDANRIDQRGDD